MIKAVAYLRVSSKSQEDNNSLAIQEKKIRAYAEAKDLDIVKVYKDVSSGSNTDRPEYKAMMDNLISGNSTIESVISYKIDRVHRSQINFLRMIEKLEALNISVITVTENINTSDPIGKLIFDVLSMFAEFERKQTSKRVKEGKDEKLDTLKPKETLSKTPLGYDNWFEIIPEEATTVKLIFNQYYSLRSFGKVKKYLDNMEMKTATGVYFSKVQISNILKNQAYCGLYIYKSVKYLQHHDRIISNNVFGKCRKIMNDRSKK